MQCFAKRVSAHAQWSMPGRLREIHTCIRYNLLKRRGRVGEGRKEQRSRAKIYCSSPKSIQNNEIDPPLMGFTTLEGIGSFGSQTSQKTIFLPAPLQLAHYCLISLFSSHKKYSFTISICISLFGTIVSSSIIFEFLYNNIHKILVFLQ